MDMSSMKLKMIDFLDYTDQALSIDLSLKEACMAEWANVDVEIRLCLVLQVLISCFHS